MTMLRVDDINAQNTIIINRFKVITCHMRAFGSHVGLFYLSSRVSTRLCQLPRAGSERRLDRVSYLRASHLHGVSRRRVFPFLFRAFDCQTRHRGRFSRPCIASRRIRVDLLWGCEGQ